MTKETRENNPPKISSEHKAQLLTKGALGAIPIVGGLAGETMDLIWKTGYEKRLEEWRNSISISLEKKLDIDKLSELINNEDFKSLLVESTLIAIRNHQEEKLNAIKNLLVNSTISPIDYDFKKLFLNLIDQFTVYHLRTIGHIYENLQLDQKNFLTLNDHMKTINEDIFHGDEEFRVQIFEELKVVKGLITSKTGPYLDYNTTTYFTLTTLGKKFVNLILDDDSA